MAGPISHQLIRDYYQAQVSRDPARIGPLLDDNIEWSIGGPIDLLQFCGERHGKQQVIDAIVRQIPSVLAVTAMNIDEILTDGDRAATFVRLSGVHASNGRTVSYRCAQFLRFRDGKLVEFRALIDSFDAAEQMLGHTIEAAPPETAHSKNVFAI
jgi:ketosteroid isomerase-like protein